MCSVKEIKKNIQQVSNSSTVYVTPKKYEPIDTVTTYGILKLNETPKGSVN